MKFKKRIVFIAPIYFPADLTGSAVIVKQMAEMLAENGFDVSVITSDARTNLGWYFPFITQRIETNFETINKVKIYRLKTKKLTQFFLFMLSRFFSFLFPQSFKDIIRIAYKGPRFVDLHSFLTKNRFDIIYCSPFPFYLNKQIIDLKSKLNPYPKIIIRPDFHIELKNYRNPQWKEIFNKADLIHALTKAEKDFLINYFQIPENKLYLLPNSLNLNHFNSLNVLKDRVEEFKAKYKLEKKKIVLFAGVKHRLKGIFTLVKVVKKLYNKDPSFILITIGLDTLSWQVFKLFLGSQNLLDLGYVGEQQKEIIFAACDVFCLVSQAEAFGLVYLEAWHKKKPVIAADIPVAREIISLAKGGLLVGFGKEKELEETILRLFSNKRLGQKLGENGYRTLITNYNFQKNTNKYVDLFTN